MVRANAFFVIAGMLAAAGARADPAELQRATFDAWQEYVLGADSLMRTRLEGGRLFLWTDEAPERAERVRNGGVLVAPLVGHGTQTVPDGLIHDWIGAVFIPNANPEAVLAVMHDYDRYKDIYKPVVTASRSLHAGVDEHEFSMVWQKHVLFVNAAMRAQYCAHDVIIDSQRGYSTVDTTSLQQIENYGGTGQHLLPADTGTGLIWRIHSILRYEERDGGVYLEIEAIVLSRDIPGSLRWLVSPAVNHLSVNSLTTTLQQTRTAVDNQRVARARLLATEHKGLN